MTEKFDHTILIVDDEEKIGKSLGRLLRTIDVKYVYLESGEEALKRLQSAASPFSLILSDQRMPGMTGSELLEKAKEIAPDTIRFLITGYADIEAVSDAVNKGSIHRYIAKPWDNEAFLETVAYGLKQHELIMENHRLFKLAKDQNTKLYTLNVNLKQSTEKHRQTIVKLDKEIDMLESVLKQGFANRDYIKEIETLLLEKHLLSEAGLNALHQALLNELYEQFQEIAMRNGFEMPKQMPGE